MRYFLMIAVFLVGFLQPMQAGINATSAGALGSRFQAGWLNGIVNVTVLSAALFVLFAVNAKTGGLPTPAGLRAMPWWAFLGGLIGATVVVVHLSAAPQLGAAVLIAIFVCGTAVGSLVCDRFGLVGYDQVAISPWRYLGMGLVVAGVILVTRTGNA